MPKIDKMKKDMSSDFYFNNPDKIKDIEAGKLQHHLKRFLRYEK